MNGKLEEKQKSLHRLLETYQHVVVAFSGGVDSTFLLYQAHQLLGNHARALTLQLHSSSQREIQEAKDFCERYDIVQQVVQVDELSFPHFAQNPPNRCYHCKKALFSTMKELASSMGDFILCDGSNADDTKDYRPGMKALEELRIKSPLLEVGLTKDEIRQGLKEAGLFAWKIPSAACLSSRFSYGQTITKEGLRMVEKAEESLMQMGFSRGLRVRVHDGLARIELAPKDLEKPMTLSLRNEIYQNFRKLGFTYVTLDIRGYHMGSMNEEILNEI